jgi:hypothetical protein
MSVADRLRGSWAILPCSRLLFRKNKVQIKDLVSSWPSGTVVICKNVDDGKMIFIAGSGDNGGYAKPGEVRATHHDQQWHSLGIYRVVDEVVYTEQHDKTVLVRSIHHNPVSQNYLEELAQMAAPVYCFK